MFVLSGRSLNVLIIDYVLSLSVFLFIGSAIADFFRFILFLLLAVMILIVAVLMVTAHCLFLFDFNWFKLRLFFLFESGKDIVSVFVLEQFVVFLFVLTFMMSIVA